MKQHEPTFLFSRHNNAMKNVNKTISDASRIYLFLDYDGTLTPIRKQPSEAVLSSSAKNILTQLSTVPDISVFIVTGRSMKIIRRLIPLKAITFAANHGLHINFKDGSEWIHVNAIHSIQVLKRVRSKLRYVLKSFPNSLVEDKQLTLSVHYRNCAVNQIAAIKNVVTDIVCSIDPTLRITKGKKVLEVRPKTIWGKKDAIIKFLEDSKPTHRPLAIFIGDDTTDEEAFETLRSVGITVHVGKSSNTAAKYYVNEVPDVFRFLKIILTLRTH